MTDTTQSVTAPLPDSTRPTHPIPPAHPGDQTGPTDTTGGSASDSPDGTEPSGGVLDDLAWRRRARDAESRLADATTGLEDCRTSLAQAQVDLGLAERRHRIERTLRDAGAIDVDAALLLTEAALAKMDAPDPEEAVSELRTSKPFLFRSVSPGSSSSSTMSAHPTSGPDELEEIRARARTTGDRRDLLRYLRTRRRRA